MFQVKVKDPWVCCFIFFFRSKVILVNNVAGSLMMGTCFARFQKTATWAITELPNTWTLENPRL